MPEPIGSIDERLAALAAMQESAAPPTSPAIERLRAALGDAAKAVQRRAAETCAALAERGWPIHDLLEQALTAPELRLRWGAVYALSRLGPLPAAAQPTLLELLGDADGDLRWAAADLLKRLAVSRREAVIADLLGSLGSVPARRKMALYCLRDLRAVEGVTASHERLTDADVDTRLAALSCLAQLDPDRHRAARCIAALLRDPEPRVQRAAAGTLGAVEVREPDIVAALEEAAASEDPSLRRAAQRSLRQLRG